MASYFGFEIVLAKRHKKRSKNTIKFHNNVHIMTEKIAIMVLGYDGQNPTEWLRCSLKDADEIEHKIVIKDCDVSGDCWERSDLPLKSFPLKGYLHGFIKDEYKNNEGNMICEFEPDTGATYSFKIICDKILT